MIPAAPDITHNTQLALAGVNRGLEQYPHAHAAAALAMIYRRYLRWCREQERWYYWNGLRWEHEDAAVVVHRILVEFIVRDIHPLLAELTAYQRSSMLGRNYLNAVEKLLTCQRGVPIGFAEFDANPFLIGTPSTTIDLRTGKPRPAVPEDLITMCTACDVAPKKEKASQWEAFLKWITVGNKDLARFFRMWFGLSLIGNNRDQKILFLWGDSANGKSVLLRAIGLVVGHYHRTASPSLFMARRPSDHGGATPGLANILFGRVVTGTEVPKGAEWDNQLIKQLCSDEPVSARKLFQDEIAVEPRCTPTIAGNDLPTMTGLDDAIKRRFLTVHCRAKRAAAEQIADYGKELAEAEGPQILRWLVDGALDRQLQGFVEPSVVSEASNAYFDSEDVLARFIAENYERDIEGVVGTTELFKAWQEYNHGLGRPRDMTMTAFSLKIQRMGFTKALNGKNQSVIRGLRPSGSGAWKNL